MESKSRASQVQAETFGDRFLRLKGDESFQSLSDRMAKAGIQLSPQGMHKWTVGGGITPENLQSIARFFDVPAAELFFGVLAPVTGGGLPPDALLLAQAMTHIPARFRKEIDRDILTLARAYTDQAVSRNLFDKIVRALDALS